MKIPEGWKLIPKKETPEMRGAFRDAEKSALLSGHDHIEAFYCGYRAMLAAAPEPVEQEVEPVGYIHRPHGLAYAWQFSDELPVSNWIKAHQVWQFVYVKPPQNDRLREAAEEAEKLLSKVDKFLTESGSGAFAYGELQNGLKYLRAALEGK